MISLNIDVLSLVSLRCSPGQLIIAVTRPNRLQYVLIIPPICAIIIEGFRVLDL